jgi:hypothetical protein
LGAEVSEEELVEEYQRGGISRRTFIRRLIIGGVSAAAAVTYADILGAATADASPRGKKKAQKRAGAARTKRPGNYNYEQHDQNPPQKRPSAPKKQGSEHKKPGSEHKKQGSAPKKHGSPPANSPARPAPGAGQTQSGDQSES